MSQYLVVLKMKEKEVMKRLENCLDRVWKIGGENRLVLW